MLPTLTQVSRLAGHLGHIRQVPSSPPPAWRRQPLRPLPRDVADLLMAGTLVTVMGLLLWWLGQSAP